MSEPDVRFAGSGSHQMLSIAAGYAQFEAAVLDGWPDRWRREARLCFYAGFQVCLKLFETLGELPEAEQITAQVAIHDEMARHIETIFREAGVVQPGQGGEP